jgi:predicted dehydrogenase
MGKSHLSLASIGVGWWGGNLASAVNQIDGVEIVSCFARTRDSREAFAAEHGCRVSESLDEIWEDSSIDGVLVAIPHAGQTELVEQAAAAGKHIFVEKPLALRSVDARRCIAATQNAGVLLQVGHNKRRQTGYRRVHQLLASGDLGELQYIETHISLPILFNPNLAEWRKTKQQLPAGGMTPLGVHMLDTINYLGGPAAKVFAYSKRVFDRMAIDNVTAALFELADGPLAYLATLIAAPINTTVGVYGSDAATWTEGDGSYLFVQKRGEPYRQEIAIETIDTLVDELTEFAECIRTDRQPEIGGAEALIVVEMLEALVESSETGHEVSLR